MPEKTEHVHDTVVEQSPSEKAGSCEHTYVSGLGLVNDDRAYFTREHFKRLCTALGLSLFLFYAISNFLGATLTFLLRFMGNAFAPNILFVTASPIFQQLLRMGTYLVGICVPYLIYMRLMRVSFPMAIPGKRMQPRVPVALFLIGIGGAVVANYISAFFSALLSQLISVPVSAPAVSAPTDPVALALFFINVTILPALVEEFIFRGVILQSIKPHGEGIAIVLSSALFALSHGSITQMVGTFCVGLILSFIVMRTGSIKVTICIHFANNLLAFLYARISAETSELYLNAIFFAVYVLCVLAGILAVIYCCRKVKGLFRLNQCIDYLSTGEKTRMAFCNPLLILAALIAVALSAASLFL